MSLVSFVDRIEIGEDGAINFVFNNVETMNLLEAIVESGKNTETKKDNKPISMNKYFNHYLETNDISSAVGGVC